MRLKFHYIVNAYILSIYISGIISWQNNEKKIYEVLPFTAEIRTIVNDIFVFIAVLSKRYFRITPVAYSDFIEQFVYISV